MPRYLVEQTLAEPLSPPTHGASASTASPLLGDDALDGVIWLHTYVSADRRRAYCICDAPSPGAVRRAAMRNSLPVDRITEVRILTPYSFT